MTLFFYRLMGAAMLDHAMYEGIEADRAVTWQAAVTVLLASIAAGIGAGGWRTGSVRMFVVASLVALACWMAWAVLVHQIGTRVMPEPQTRAPLGELLRTVGFSASPGLLLVFAAFPVVTLPVFGAVLVWMFAAMVVGVRHALDYSSTRRAIAACALAFVLVLVLAFTLGVMFGSTVS